ncbi:MAG: hypothetical protein CMJ76_04870 [Planctomycetaceae bacterium]|nr:hypothetical protein [Planctomycetaceae bacterium]
MQIVAPNLREIRELPLAENHDDIEELSWNKGNGILFGLGSLLVAIGLGLSAFHLYCAQQIDMTNFTEAQLAYGNAVIDQMPPLAAIQQWRLVRGIGLGEQRVDDFLAKQSEYRSLHLFAYIELGLAGLGLAMGVMAIFARRRIRAPDSR